MYSLRKLVVRSVLLVIRDICRRLLLNLGSFTSRVDFLKRSSRLKAQTDSMNKSYFFANKNGKYALGYCLANLTQAGTYRGYRPCESLNSSFACRRRLSDNLAALLRGGCSLARRLSNDFCTFFFFH